MKPPVLLLLLSLLYASAAWAQPVAEAGPDQFAECIDGVGAFELDGSGSEVQVEPPTYLWTGPFGTVDGLKPTVEVPLGTNEVTLTVRDGNLVEDTDTTNLIVIDTVPPDFDLELNPSRIRADGRSHTIRASIVATDACAQSIQLKLLTLQSSNGGVAVPGAPVGEDSRHFSVPAVLGPGGRELFYTAVYEARDQAGNVTLLTGRVTVDRTGALTSDPGRLLYYYRIGGEVPPAQPLAVRALQEGPIQVTTDDDWVRVTGPSRAPAEMSVSIDPEGLEPGEYRSYIRIDHVSGLDETVRVDLLVADEPRTFVMPESLRFSQDVSRETPAQSVPLTQTVFVGAVHSQMPFTVETDVDWLVVGSGANQTPTRLTVTALPDGLEVGLHTAQITVTPDDPAGAPITIPVELNVFASAGVQLPTFVVDAATMRRRPVAPGQLVTAFWDNPFASEETAGSTPLPTSLAGLSGSVAGEAVHFSFVSSNQFNGQLPTTMAPGVQRLDLFFEGGFIGSIPLQVLPASPAVFESRGVTVAVNEDGRLNGPGSPARQAVTLFATGQGLTYPTLATGAAAPSGPFAAAALPVSATIDGAPADVLWSGMAPGQVGLFQINLSTAGLEAGEHRVVLTVGSWPSNSATIYIAP